MTKSHDRLRRSAVAFGLAVALCGCNGNVGQQETPTAETRSEESAAPAASPSRKLSPEEQIAASQADLAERLDVDPEAVTLAGATPVTWRSGALGCPEPGMSYTQALVPGIWIMMKAGDKVYRYHAARNREPFFCPDDRAELPFAGGGAD